MQALRPLQTPDPGPQHLHKVPVAPTEALCENLLGISALGPTHKRSIFNLASLLGYRPQCCISQVTCPAITWFGALIENQRKQEQAHHPRTPSPWAFHEA